MNEDQKDVKLTETLRVTAHFGGQSKRGTLTGRRTAGPVDENKDLVEVTLDEAPNSPIWIPETDATDDGDEYEASIMCEYGTDSPEEAALSLLWWLRSGSPDCVNVRCKGRDGYTYGVDVRWIDGVPSATLDTVHAANAKTYEDQPEWARALIDSRAIARDEAREN